MTIISKLARRVLLGAAAALGAVQPIAAQAAPSWVANDDDALLFDIRLGQYRLGDGVRGYQTPGGTCIDLADTIMALDISLRLDKKLRRATGWAFDERRTITIDREANIAQIMNKSEKLASTTIYDTPEGWCVDTVQLAGWLGVDLRADQTNALLFITSTTKLPVELQLERRARAGKVRTLASFDLSSLPQASAPFKGFKAPSIDAAVNFGGLRQSGKAQLSASYELYAAGEVGPIGYNARLSSDQRGLPQSLRVQAYRSDPAGRLLGPAKATYVAAGDVSGVSTALVAQASAGRGAVITNRPLERRDSFDRTDFRGELPRGWDAELYRNGQLLGLTADRADGRYEFVDIPLLYGQNRFEIVLYGPQGQVRREVRNVPVGLDSIPPRKTYYWLGGYEEGQDLITLGRGTPVVPGQRRGWRGAFGLERGLNAKTSVAAYALTQMLQGGERRSFGEVALRRAVGPTLVEISGSAALEGGYAGRVQMLGQFGSLNVSAESIVAGGGFESDRVLRGVTGLHSASVDYGIKLGRTVLPLHIDTRYTTRTSGDRSLETGARISTSIGAMSFTGEVDYRTEFGATGRRGPSVMTANLLANARIGGVRLRGETRFNIAPEAGFASATLIGEWSAGRDDRYRNDWRAELGYDRALRRARAAFGYVRRFEKVAVTASVEAGTDGSVAGGLSLAFSLGRDPARGGLRITSSRLATQGQALVRVFRDLNGDGIRQAGEPDEKDVQIAAGRVPVERLTGADGQVVVDGLEPHQPVLVGLDASSLPDPLVQPGSPGLVVTPRPGVAIALDLPLVSAGEVDGTLVRAGGGNLEGVDVELIDVEGRVAVKSRTDFDGFFLFEGVPYGRYTLRIGTLSAQAARLQPVLSRVALVSGAVPSVHLGAVAAAPSVQQAAQ